MELYYHTDNETFEILEPATIDLISGQMDYIRYIQVGGKWEAEYDFIDEEVLQDAITMGVLRPATADEARALGLEPV